MEAKFDEVQGPPKSFAWLTGPGIYYGDIVGVANLLGDRDNILENAQLFPYASERLGGYHLIPIDTLQNRTRITRTT